jgi:hypothetical protein
MQVPLENVVVIQTDMADSSYHVAPLLQVGPDNWVSEREV